MHTRATNEMLLVGSTLRKARLVTAASGCHDQSRQHNLAVADMQFFQSSSGSSVNRVHAATATLPQTHPLAGVCSRGLPQHALLRCLNAISVQYLRDRVLVHHRCTRDGAVWAASAVAVGSRPCRTSHRHPSAGPIGSASFSRAGGFTHTWVYLARRQGGALRHGRHLFHLEWVSSGVEPAVNIADAVVDSTVCACVHCGAPQHTDHCSVMSAAGQRAAQQAG